MKSFFSISLACFIGLFATGLCAAAADTDMGTPSSSAQRLYAEAREDLLQIRVLINNGRSQASVGSGFLLADSDLVVTNYHVISQIALEPEVYTGEYLDTQGRRGNLQLLAVDVLRDLAVVRIDRQGSGFFRLPDPSAQLAQGEHLYALGNPLDLGFAISEGTYNGVIRRDFSDLLLFSGALNSGMSGGPSITASGRIAGVNVAHRRDGELVSFLVPAHYLQALLSSIGEKPPEDFNPLIAAQLLEHQGVMLDRLLESPLTLKQLGAYRVPVRESEQLRCWGDTNTRQRNGYSGARIQCSMESSIFVSSELRTGHVAISHSLLQRNGLDRWRFARTARELFSDQIFRSSFNDSISGPVCTEDFIESNGLPLRAVLCFSAYNKLEGLYTLDLFSVTTDDPDSALLSQMSMRGTSWENGLRLADAFLSGMQSATDASVISTDREGQP
ncbi:MAG: serine protease [Pseudomonas sp.]